MGSSVSKGGWRAAAVIAAALVGSMVLPVGPAAAVHGGVPGDFNGDGYRDAVLPAPGANVAGKEAAGAVVVLYGSSSGLATARRKTLTQNTTGIPGTAEAYDRFGAATATEDLNRDGYADLVISSPYEDTAKGANSGAVTVVWGSRSGLTSGTDLPSPSSDPEHFGVDLAALSGGAGTKTRVLVGGLDGSVLFTGSFSRTGTFGSATLNQDTPSPESVALGDLNGDTTPDRVLVTVRMSGLSGGEIYTNPAYENAFQQGNGLISATGDLNGDGYADLVVGDPDEPEVAGTDGMLGGRVLVWYGSASGIASNAKPVQITQNTSGVPGGSEKGDAFGGALAVTDVNRDKLADIVVGAPYENVGSTKRAGAVTVIPGRASGALGTGSYSFTQDTSGVPSVSETDDFFGTAVSAGDINRDGKPELFVGASGENNSTGAEFVLPGGSTRPTGTGSKVITAPSIGLTQQHGTLLGGNGLLWVI
ncbi:FG-GAP-like repeat-containing protein [Streptomyces sp. DG2A-72]|uniref:FG-GAP-like repeat-containing protein n=1 Tax=Streptomyces sp. DG2A-72 TaxID=3051386 RepID=UPI00265C1415|nr:FG-GAP-like repeat-containing protein [Streptomyces sp. DG2A-72]MDO0934741.1 FG-GAP-like repeat-containing protein [Streptomyces sp. DG2A-72]